MFLAPFGFTYFSDRVLHFSPGLAKDCNSPTSASCIASITGVNHNAPLFFETGSHQHLFLGLPQITVLFCPQIAGITGVSQCTQQDSTNFR
jgi:hypothetical protein